MVWLFVTVVGFLVVTALVMGLARSSTAGWERDKRVSRAPQREAAGSPPPAGGATRLRRAWLRTAAATPRVAGALAASLRQGLGDLPQPRRLLSRLSPVRRAIGTLGAAAPGGLIRPWRRGTSSAGRDLTDGHGQGGGVVVEQPVRRPRTRRGSGILRRRHPIRLPHRLHRRGVGGSTPDADQRPVDMTPGASTQEDPG